MDSPATEFDFGIEKEGYWKGKTGTDLADESESTKAFAEALVSRYNQNVGEDLLCVDFSHGSHPGHYDVSNSKYKWIVTTDHAIGVQKLDSSESPEGHPLEFVSTKLTFGPDSEWREDVKKHWATLLQIGEVEVDSMCATQVHISPKEQQVWSLEQLKQVAKAVVYFENAFKIISAPSRRDHELTQSNKGNNRLLKNLGFGECCDRIQQCPNNLELIKVMQPDDRQTNPPTRDYAWNFMNTDKEYAKSGRKPIGTIEFRCAPGVTTAEHCLIWVELAVSFVQAAAQYNTKDGLEKGEYKPNVKGLKDFILKAKVPNMNRTDLLEIVFDGIHDDGPGWPTDKKMRDVFDKKLKEGNLVA